MIQGALAVKVPKTLAESIAVKLNEPTIAGETAVIMTVPYADTCPKEK